MNTQKIRRFHVSLLLICLVAALSFGCKKKAGIASVAPPFYGPLYCMVGTQTVYGDAANTCCQSQGVPKNPPPADNRCTSNLTQNVVSSLKSIAGAMAATESVLAAGKGKNGSTATLALGGQSNIIRPGSLAAAAVEDRTPAGGANTSNTGGGSSAGGAQGGLGTGGDSSGSGSSGGGSGSGAGGSGGAFGSLGGLQTSGGLMGGSGGSDSSKGESLAQESGAAGSMYASGSGGGGSAGGSKSGATDLFGGGFGGAGGGSAGGAGSIDLTNGRGAGSGKGVLGGSGGRGLAGGLGTQGGSLGIMRSKDPENYFALLSISDNLFQIVEKRYGETNRVWAIHDAQGTVTRVPTQVQKSIK